ncbi:PREDICTED: uncharacterized protein LOC109483497 [Branchiostoma belcheri]|uniref:Uncharacterized protein LOC109483497 n=1 Tax=Branchiostoma belcheri TaxID=7741 RepID=A0A6P4ZLL2_BRABE|nr:PREDICTED: uncharacterized protein LOC109483497 [Branchiostoma belcheri]
MALAPQKSGLESVARIVLACLLFFLQGASGQGVEAEVWHSSGDWASGVDYGFYDSEGAFDAEGGGVAAEAVDDYAVIANADTLVSECICEEFESDSDSEEVVGVLMPYRFEPYLSDVQSDEPNSDSDDEGEAAGDAMADGGELEIDGQIPLSNTRK